MKDARKFMLGKRRFRIGERLEARRDAGQTKGAVLTETDVENLATVSAKVRDAIDLLNKEIAAINEGRLGIVSEIFERKAAILKWLELRLPLIEPFLTHEAARDHALPARLGELKHAISEDSELLSRVAAAAGTIVREIEKSFNRNSLNGLYGKTGEKIGGPSGHKMRLDREL